MWSDDTATTTLPLVFPFLPHFSKCHLFHSWYLHPPEPLMLTPFIHLWLALAALLFVRLVIQPSRIHPLSASASPSPSLSLTCPSSVKGKVLVWEMAVWRVKRMRRTNTHTQIHIQTHTYIHTSSVRQWCDGQHWHLAGGTIRWWRRVGEEKASDTIESG